MSNSTPASLAKSSLFQAREAGIYVCLLKCFVSSWQHVNWSLKNHILASRNDTSWKVICSNRFWFGSWFSVRRETQRLWECLPKLNCFSSTSVVLWKAITRSPELSSLYMLPVIWNPLKPFGFNLPSENPFFVQWTSTTLNTVSTCHILFWF